MGKAQEWSFEFDVGKHAMLRPSIDHLNFMSGTDGGCCKGPNRGMSQKWYEWRK